LINKILIDHEKKHNYYLQNGIDVSDFVHKNKQQMHLLRNEVTREIININSTDEEARRERAQKNKHMMELNERKLKYFYMHKWEIIKNKVLLFTVIIIS
jgi:hypothetical protein